MSYDPSTLTDAELVERVRAGDRAAAAEFLSRHEPLIRSKVRPHLGRAMRRWVGVSDLLSSIGRRLDDATRRGAFCPDGPPHLRAYICGIARNAVSERSREHVRADRALKTARHGMRTATDDDGYDSSTIHEAVERLPMVDQQIMRMRIDGTPFKIIADRMGLQEPGVRQRWRRSRTRMRQFLTEPSS